MAEVTPEQAQQVIEQVQQAAPASTQPVRIQTSTGQVFEGATDQEVLQKLVQSVESGTAHIRNLNDRIDTLQQQVHQVQQPPQQQTGQKTPQDTYWELWQKDPIAADRYATSVRLGVPVEHVDQIERQTVINSAATAQNTALSDFYNRCPDYPVDDPEAAQAMKNHLARAYPNQPVTADTLELAFNALTRQGTVTPLDIPIEGYAEPQGTMPRVGSGSQLPPMDFEQQFRQLSPDQMRQAIEQLHARGAR